MGLKYRKENNKYIVLYIFSSSRKSVEWDREATEKLNRKLAILGEQVFFINCDKTFIAKPIAPFIYPQGFEGYVSPQALEIIQKWAAERKAS